MRSGISIRQRLTVTHVGLTFVLLATLGWVSYLYFETNQEHILDDFLKNEAKTILVSCDNFWKSHSDISVNLQDSVFQKFLQNYWSARLNEPSPFKSTIFLFDSSGRVVGSSNQALHLEGHLSRLDKSRETFKTVTFRGPPYRVLDRNWTFKGRRLGSVSVACLLTDKNATAWGFGLTLFLLLAASVLVSSFLGAFLIEKAFKPVAEMARAASRISETNLKDRLPEPPGNDEVGFLSRTLNALLQRLEVDKSFQENLVQDLSHQLRTPLTVLRGRNENALNLLEDRPRVREVLEDNLMDIDQIVAFLNTMLHLAKLENGLETTQKVREDVLHVIKELGEELQPLWEEKNLHFVVSKEGEDISWENFPATWQVFDPFQTRQALMNILDNAYRYAPEGSRIRVDFSENCDDEIVFKLTIFNEGPPIPQDSMEKIFKRFFRVRGQPETEGFGLGLAIARSLMESQHGHLRAFNPPQGGAAFELSWEYEKLEKT